MTPSLLTLFGKSLNDFFSAKILTLTLFPALFGITLWGGVLYIFGNEIYTYLSQMLLGFMPDWLNTQGTAQSILNGIIHFSLSFALYTLFGIFFLIAILLTNMLFSIFYTPFIVEYVRVKSYSHLPKAEFGSLLGCILMFMKHFLFSLFLTLITLLLYLVPFIGSLLGSFGLFVVWYLFFKKTTFYDVGSSSMEESKFQYINQTRFFTNHAYALSAYLLNYVPFFNFFLMPLQILLITHYFFTRLDENITS
ncbi:peptidase [Helicobacter cinaedi]|uniref:EI24 domain-containing protein n=1 Tax=Helicobacter cinaedi TaxID=213 RepID=UPI001F2714BA|nr:EI24 domain-containing protein [Helicobacter cinaedi]BDB65350.1 peptidase [Helicobacter cinaedi]